MSAAELDAFVDLVRGKADATRGAAIYARENLKCVTCHRIDTAGGRVDKAGGRVGPNLTAIGASSPLDYVIDSLLYPAKNVKEGYNTVVVQTDDGQVITGIQVARSDAELILRTCHRRRGQNPHGRHRRRIGRHVAHAHRPDRQPLPRRAR